MIAILSGLRNAAFDDDYRWQSAELWARDGRWIRVPYRLTNGTAMSEMLHVPAAAFHTLTGAHWASTSLWVCAAMAAAAIGSRLGLSVPVAIIAVLSLPVFTASASTLNSDIPSLAFALAGLVLLILSRTTGRPGPTLFVAGLLFAAVLSAKFVVLACLPFALLCLLVADPAPVAMRFKRAAVVAAPVVGTALLWMAHTTHLTGRPFDSTGKHLARSRVDPMWLDGEAAGRIPQLHDLFRLPIEPVLTTVLGQEEPFGGRTGLLWLALLPATVALVLACRIPWKPPTALAVVGVGFYVLLAPFVLKTRFLMLFFVAFALLSAVAYERRRLLGRPVAVAIAIVFAATAALGVADGVRKLLFNVVLITPPAAHAPRAI